MAVASWRWPHARGPGSGLELVASRGGLRAPSEAEKPLLTPLNHFLYHDDFPGGGRLLLGIVFRLRFCITRANPPLCITFYRKAGYVEQAA